MDDSQFLEELKKDFFEEANTLIETLEENILILEKDINNKEALNEIFRAAHTLKGGAATLDLDRISNFTHELENLLDELRSNNIQVNMDIVDLLLKAIDIVKKMIEASQEDRELEIGYEDEIFNNIKKIYMKDITEEEKSKALEDAITKKEKTKIDYKLNEYERYLVKNALSENSNVFEIFIILNEHNPMKTVSGIQIFSILKSLGETVKSFPDLDDLMSDQFHKEVHFLFITKHTDEEIKNKVFLSDVTDYVEVTPFTEKEQAEVVSSSEEEKFEVSDLEITEDDAKTIFEHIKKGDFVYKIDVMYDETNPMRSVSGLLFYTMLTSKGIIIKSKPTFEDYKKDIFIDKAHIVFATTLDPVTLHKKLYISDVTKELKFHEFKDKGETKEIKPEREPVGVTTVKQVNGRDLNQKEEQEKKKAEPVMANTETKPKREHPQPTSTPQSAAKEQKKHTASSMLRVESKRIDDVLNLVGELVTNKASLSQIAEDNNTMLEDITTFQNTFKKEIRLLSSYMNQITSYISSQEEKSEVENSFQTVQEIITKHLDSYIPKYKSLQDKLRVSSQSLSRITNDLQESVMKVRMVPINQIFSRFPRLIRDLSKELNKEINLVMQGEDTELDKSLVEDLIDPLIHIVRNAVDHGIETPEERTARNKSREGTLLLKAEHEGNMIVITIEDDGSGISKQKILNKAIERGLVEPGHDVSDSDILQFLFQPGFSTAERVTSLSGRGVGMDVVKRRIEGLNGTISLITEENKGSRFTIKLPLTLAIIQALMVKVSDYIYSIPINSVGETQRIFADEIEYLENNEVIRVRDEVLSIVRLDQVFRHFSDKKQDYFYVIIVETTSSKKIGLVVDGLIGEMDIVIKPLDSTYALTPGIAGATILGDGEVSLIIDIPSLYDFIMENRAKKFFN